MTVTVVAPAVEHHREPLGIGESRPRLSFKVAGPACWSQQAYDMEVVFDGGAVEVARVESAESVLMPWPFRSLRSREPVRVRVRVLGTGQLSDWSPPTTLEVGLLSPGDWQGQPVGGNWEENPDSDTRRPPLVRRSFELDRRPVCARLYVTAHGLYEVEINGGPVSVRRQWLRDGRCTASAFVAPPTT